MFRPADLLTHIDGVVDRAIGADGLTPPVREKLLRRQLASVSQMTPALLGASFVVSGAFLAMSWGSSRFVPTAIIAVMLNLFYGHAILLSYKQNGEGPDNLGRAVNRTIIYCLVLGILWGLMFNILPISQDQALRTSTLIGFGGLLCISVMALVNYPQALAAFTIPLIVGALTGLADLGRAQDLWIQTSLLTGFTFIMVTVTFNHAASFVALRASETQVQENGEIIGLLLREFEQAKSDWIWGFDPDGSINRLSVGFTSATGVSEDVLLGADFVYFLRCITQPGDPLMAQLERDVDARETFQDVELIVTAAGQECWWSLTGKPAFDEAGGYLGYIGTGSDISQRKVAERRITMLAHHDTMTGLLNRTKFTEQLGQCVARLERYGTPFTVMFLDLDQFKAVNDTRGHLAGDKLLMQVSARIQAQMRDTDMAARLGGDEFAIILPNDCDSGSVESLAARLITEIRKPFLIEDEQINIGVSIGIAMAPVNGTRPDQILRNADLALYRAKADGRSVYRFFENQMDSEARERRLLEVELRDAIGNGELLLYYQPLVSADDGQPTGFEALIRWNHPIRGIVAPSEFISIAEQSNLIVDIGDWTIQQACSAASSWPEHLTVAVNLSAKHFRRSDIGLVVKRALAQSGLAPERLEIEITEGLLMEDPDDVVKKLAEIRELGVTIAMDDFGTGYSSLSYLLKFPFDKIKIDRSFVEASTKDEVARDILRAIASLGKTLKLKITAEGVETAEQAAFLSEIACHQLQGFYFARPLDGIDMPHYLLSTVPTKAPEVKAAAQRALAG